MLTLAVAPPPALHALATEWDKLPFCDTMDQAQSYLVDLHMGGHHLLCRPSIRKRGTCNGPIPEVVTTTIWVVDTDMAPTVPLRVLRTVGTPATGWETVTVRRGVFAKARDRTGRTDVPPPPLPPEAPPAADENRTTLVTPHSKIVTDPEAVATIVNLRSQGLSHAAIAERMAADGHVTKTGRPVKRYTVTHILRKASK